MSGAASSCGRAFRNSCASRRCRRPTSSRRTSSSSTFCPGAAAQHAADALAAIDAVHALGPKAILVTSLHTDETPDRRDRSRRLGCIRPLPRAHAEAADLGQRRGRRHRGAVLRALPAHGIGRRGAVARGVLDLRPAQAHRRRRLARNPADRRAGRIRHSRAACSRPRDCEEPCMRRRFVTLDVFTDKRFAGNPLAVVLEPDGLDTAAMQTIAREFNLSETVFVFPPADKAHRAKLRIFTPVRELPFAGHPTVGTAVLLGRIDGGDGAQTSCWRSRSARCRAGSTPAARTAAARVRHSAPAGAGRRSRLTTRRSRRRSGLRSPTSGSTGSRRRAGRRATRSRSCRCAASMRSGAAGSIWRASTRRSAATVMRRPIIVLPRDRRAGHVVPRAHVRARHGRAEDPGDRFGGRGVRRLSGGDRQLRRRRASRRASSRATRWAARA